MVFTTKKFIFGQMLSQIPKEGGEEEMAQAGTPEVEAEVMEEKGML